MAAAERRAEAAAAAAVRPVVWHRCVWVLALALLVMLVVVGLLMEQMRVPLVPLAAWAPAMYSTTLPSRSMDHAFAVVCQGRSGSTYLVSTLNKHPNMTVYGEILHPPKYDIKEHSGSCHYHVFFGFGEEPAKAKYRRASKKARDKMVREYLDMFVDDRLCEYGFCNNECDRQGTALARPGEAGGVTPCGPACVAKTPGEYKGMVGMKILIGDTLNMAIPTLQSYNGFRILYLVRRDILMRCLSKLHRVQMRDDKRLGLPKKTPLRASVKTVLKRIEHDIRAEERHSRQIRMLNAERHRVWYEDLVEADHENRWEQGPWRGITDFLGVEPHSLNPSTHERHPKTTMEEVQKYYPMIAEYRKAARHKFPAHAHRLGCEVSHLFPDDPCDSLP